MDLSLLSFLIEQTLQRELGSSPLPHLSPPTPTSPSLDQSCQHQILLSVMPKISSYMEEKPPLHWCPSPSPPPPASDFDQKLIVFISLLLLVEKRRCKKKIHVLSPFDRSAKMTFLPPRQRPQPQFIERRKANRKKSGLQNPVCCRTERGKRGWRGLIQSMPTHPPTPLTDRSKKKKEKKRKKRRKE